MSWAAAWTATKVAGWIGIVGVAGIMFTTCAVGLIQPVHYRIECEDGTTKTVTRASIRGGSVEWWDRGKRGIVTKTCEVIKIYEEQP